MSIFDFFDKRAKFLKNENSPLAGRALDLYYGYKRSFSYFCGVTGSDDNDWDAFKNWLINWVLRGQVDDTELLQIYLNWIEHEHFLTSSVEESVRSLWDSGGPTAFNKKDDVSGQFWIFAAFAEQTIDN